jgi:hypothetical protein
MCSWWGILSGQECKAAVLLEAVLGTAVPAGVVKVVSLRQHAGVSFSSWPPLGLAGLPDQMLLAGLLRPA